MPSERQQVTEGRGGMQHDGICAGATVREDGTVGLGGLQRRWRHWTRESVSIHYSDEGTQMWWACSELSHDNSTSGYTCQSSKSRDLRHWKCPGWRSINDDRKLEATPVSISGRTDQQTADSYSASDGRGIRTHVLPHGGAGGHRVG